LRWRRKGGPEAQAIGSTKGGRNTKIHVVVDELCRPRVLLITPGNTADCVMAEQCVSLIPGILELLADKGFLPEKAGDESHHPQQVQSQETHPP
jgi:hypothetical protein